MSAPRITVDTAAADLALARLRVRVRGLSGGYVWVGGYSRGAMTQRRAVKRTEAEERNARTSPERRRAARR